MIGGVPYIANENVRATLALCRTHPTECTCQECTAIFDLASDHRYDCRCELCKFWWERVGPERDDDGDEP